MRCILSLLIFLLAFPLHAAFPAQREVRAVWLTTLMGLDWPRRAATTPAEETQQREALCRTLDELQAAGINLVFFQARLRGTTAYRSAIEPWDAVFTGRAGRAPGYDPLKFAVEECHKRKMACHAWVVAFPIETKATARQLGNAALSKRRPDLCTDCGDRYMMNPGAPGTADYLAKVCKEIVENYTVDGIHLDYIRYPESAIKFSDAATYRAYGGGKERTAWRRANVTRCVAAIYEAVKKVRPWVAVSCSPVGKHADLARYSSFGWNARDAVAQDAQQWLKDGIMDMLFPMMYFDGVHFYPFAADWAENMHGRIVCPGLGIYFLSPSEKNWPLVSVQRQLNVARQLGLGGAAFFRARFLTDNVKGLYSWLRNDFYREPALMPAMTWLDNEAPAAPNVTASRTPDGRIHLSWQATPDATPVTYNIYRLDTLRGDVLLQHGEAATHYAYRPALPAFYHSRYAVTAVDSYGNESEAKVVEVPFK